MILNMTPYPELPVHPAPPPVHANAYTPYGGMLDMLLFKAALKAFSTGRPSNEVSF